MGGVEQGGADDGHVGNAVLKAADHEDQDAPDYHDEPSGLVFQPYRAPDGQAHADVAQDATGEKCQSALADLALGSGDKEAGDCLVAGDAGGLEDQDEYPGTQ